MSFIEAKLQFLTDRENAVYYASEAGNAQAAKHDGQFEFRMTKIYNGRDKELKIHENGFQLIISEPTKVQNFFNDTELENIYNNEIEQIILQYVPGAKRVHIFDHTRRTSSSELRVQQQCSREPSTIIHNDYTEASAQKRLHDLLPDEFRMQQQERFAIINLWRSIDDDIIESWPLTFCDGQTINNNDLIAVKRIAKDRIGEIQMLLYNKKQIWYYFPYMNKNELIIFKTYDNNNKQGIVRFTPHTAFDDPTSKHDAKPRQSIETRAFVFF